MNGLLSLAACAIIVVLGVWLFGGFVLRACGTLLAVGELASAALTGSPGDGDRRDPWQSCLACGAVAIRAAPRLLPLAARSPCLSPMAAHPV